jgi:glutamate synthase domain-containing protein 1/glutamate synthase domain-containing protein 3
MARRDVVERILRSRESLAPRGDRAVPLRKGEAEGGCGVIGVASSEPVAGRHLLQALRQMRNRGNGKGGGIAAVGLLPGELGVSPPVLENDYLLTIAYLEARARSELERDFIERVFHVDHARIVPRNDEPFEPAPPDVVQYFVRVRPEAVGAFCDRTGLDPSVRVQDEIVYQNSYRLNRAFYGSAGDKRAFVLSHGKNMFVLKMVGYGDDVIRCYRLEDLHAHVWIGHHRYPTKGRVWHPGGAHPFVGLHEALVHNGDFANYASICEYLAQRNIYPLFLTDTEVSVLIFDLFHRTYGYPLEYVIESLAPTTERDFSMLPEDRQRIYRLLQTAHIHGSPDGPWFFLIAQSAQPEQVFRLIGITDTSMLRPQVFALQQGPAAIGLAASEKQAIDAVLESLSREDPRFWTHADRYWHARGGSHTDGGAFLFTVRPDACGPATLLCTDKFGRPILTGAAQPPCRGDATAAAPPLAFPDLPAPALFAWLTQQFAGWEYTDLLGFLDALTASALQDPARGRAIEVLTLLLDRRYATGPMRPSSLQSIFDKALAETFESVRRHPSEAFCYSSVEAAQGPTAAGQAVVLDARGFEHQGERSLAREIVRLCQCGFRRIIVIHARGHRFIACGLGPDTKGVRIDVYGSSGDYLASGIDGAEVYVHGDAQDQLAQIMKDGKLVVYGGVGQTFMYGGKGGESYVLGSAAGRPLINAVGRPRVVINGTCLDYLAEAFMAGDPLEGGGFVILNGIAFNEQGEAVDLDAPYPGSNLFSLASGGAIYIRDPHCLVSEEQLNGGEFAPVEERDWALIRPYLEENERLFGISIARLLEQDGTALPPAQVYRKIRPKAIAALQPEEAWTKMHA